MAQIASENELWEKLHAHKSAFAKYLNWLDTKNTSLSAVATVF